MSVIVLLLALAVCPMCGGTGQVPDPQPNPQPTPAAATPYFALQPGDSQSRALSEATLKLQGVSGLTIRVRPQWLSVNGKWDFSFPDACVKRCHNTGDVYTLLLMGGDTAQPWQESTATFYEQAFKALGARYASDPACVGVHVCGSSSPQGTSEELHWKPLPKEAISNLHRMTVACAEAFPRQWLIYAGSLKDVPGCQKVILDAMQQAPGRVLVKTNALKADTNLNAGQNQLVIWAGKQGAMIGFEMVNPVGSGLQGAIAKGRQVEQMAGRKLSYIAVYPPDLSKLGSLK